MPNILQGKTAVVTGAGSGVGRAIATLFAAEGAAVAALDVNEAGVNDTVAQVEAAGGKASAHVVDISKSTSVDGVVEAVISEYGTVDILINNAGISDNSASLLDTDESLWDRIMNVDLKGIYLLTRALMPTLQAQSSASVVNTASIAGLVAGAGGASYTAAKHGVIGLTKSIAHDYSPSVRCNVVLPGLVETPMLLQPGVPAEAALAVARATPAERAAQPIEVARAVLFLASDDASFVYGSQLVVDGGWTLS